MTDIFYSRYAVEINKSIFPKYNKNKFIDGHMSYVLDGNNKYNMILVRDLNV